MTIILLVVFILNAIAVGWSFFFIGDAIKRADNPLVYILLSIGLVCTIAVLAQTIAKQPEDGVHSEHASH